MIGYTYPAAVCAAGFFVPGQERIMLKIAIYGKGGIGKSTVTSNLAAAFAAM